MKLRIKIIIYLLIAGLVPVMVLTAYSYYQGQATVRDTIFGKLSAINSIKSVEVKHYFKELEKEVISFSQSSDVQMIFNNLRQYHDDMNTRADQPYDVSTEEYKKIWHKTVPAIKDFKENYGFNDVYIICASHGHVMISVEQKDDLGSNLGYGPYKDTHFAQLWKKIVSTAKFGITDILPYAGSNNDPAGFVGYPIFSESGDVLAALVVQTSIKPINEIMKLSEGMGKTGESYLVGSDYFMRSDSYHNPEKFSVHASFKEKNSLKTFAVKEALNGQDGVGVIANYEDLETLASWRKVEIGDGIKWALISEMESDEAFASIYFMRNMILLGLLVLNIVNFVFAFWAGGQIMATIDNILFRARKVTEGILAGNLSSKMNEGKVSVDFKELARQINELISSFVKPLNDAMSVMKRLAQKDLSARMQGQYQGEFEMFKSNINLAAENLAEAINNVNQSVEQMNSVGEQVATSSQVLSQGATEQAASLEEITSSMGEIGSQTKTNAENARQAQKISEQTKSSAHVGNEQMKEMLSSMSEINKSSENISKIIKVIDEIAFQTNLLALNAAVEAARAGQHGKGFAVVAEEVRNLAARSATAAKETTTLIEDSHTKVSNGSTTAQETAKALEEIVTDATKVSDLVNEISAASNEQAQGISEVVSALEQIDQVTQKNTASSQQSAAAAEELSSQVRQLKVMIDEFNLDKKNRSKSAEPKRASKMINENSKTSIFSTGIQKNQASSEKEKFNIQNSSAQNLASNDSWGKDEPDPVIKLDDDDFGKY